MILPNHNHTILRFIASVVCIAVMIWAITGIIRIGASVCYAGPIDWIKEKAGIVTDRVDKVTEGVKEKINTVTEKAPSPVQDAKEFYDEVKKEAKETKDEFKTWCKKVLSTVCQIAIILIIGHLLPIIFDDGWKYIMKFTTYVIVVICVASAITG